MSLRRLLPLAPALAWTALAAPAWAIDVEVTAPRASVEEPAATEATPAPEDAEPTGAAPAVETGSIETPAEQPAPAVTGTIESPLAGALKTILEAEAAAAAAAAANEPPLAEGAKRPPKSAEQRDAEAIQAFYAERNGALAWVTKDGLTEAAKAAVAEVLRIGDWGLDVSAIVLPKLAQPGAAGAAPSDQELADAEIALSRAFLKYHLLARGGAIYDAPQQLSSYLARRPQLRDRKTVLADLAASADPAAYLVGMQPKHPEFERLRQAWLATRGDKAAKGKVSADQLLANMQQWRWLPEDLGAYHVWLNVPEYTVRIVKDGEAIWTERATVGLVSKQTPIFSDEIERITFKSRWRVPDSIKVKEVWPSLLRGGGMMRQFGLVMTKKDSEEPVDWRSIDWSKADMNDYILWQPPGPKNQLGLVKFSFPSKHRVYMHDTPDKHMFAWSRRAVSHGCMRIRNPLSMATLILGNDQGWDRTKIDDMVANAPDHTVVELDRKVPVHITYFTVRIDESGKVSTFGDIYGHEKRVRQALAGQWDRIARGADHLAPLDQSRVPRVAAGPTNRTRALREPRTLTELMFGGS